MGDRTHRKKIRNARKGPLFVSAAGFFWGGGGGKSTTKDSVGEAPRDGPTSSCQGLSSVEHEGEVGKASAPFHA